ncbi:MAG: hypothetical protein LBV79_06990 [Candidatus Adiutrix sp.]|jgi:hypothetical protein|nr:hypothetical protein [Candidatus Adiutrix sp.]
MARTGVKKAAIKSPHSKKQREVLAALETAVRRTGLKVSAGQLRFAGLKLKSGSCLLRDKRWLILDKSQPFEDLVDLYRQVLTPQELITCGLPEESVALLIPYLGQAVPAGTDEAA